jgi:hypothetical protein
VSPSARNRKWPDSRPKSRPNPGPDRACLREIPVAWSAPVDEAPPAPPHVSGHVPP